MKSINDLLQHGTFEVRELGQKAVQYKTQLEQGKITQGEYDQLCAQLVGLKALEGRADLEDARQDIAQAVEFLRGFLGIVMG